MKVYIHSDDFGLFPSVTRKLLDQIDGGILNSVSVVVNNNDPLLSELSRIKSSVRLCLHLNLTDGKPLCDPKMIPDLVDEDGHLNATFEKIFIKSFLKPRSMARQIHTEISAQFQKFYSFFENDSNDRPFTVDGHNHIQVIPAVFKTISDLSGQYGIKDVRIPTEPFLLGNNFSQKISKLLSSNFIKQMVVRTLTFTNSTEQKLLKSGLVPGPKFWGILDSGAVNSERSLQFIYLSKQKKVPAVEITFHSGRCSEQDVKDILDRNPRHQFFTSTDRDFEASEAVKLTQYLANEI